MTAKPVNFLIPPDRDDVETIRASRLFDAEWYLSAYPDVTATGIDAAEHYLWLGARLNRKPSPKFDPAQYLKRNADVAAAGVNPLLHYERARQLEKKRPDPSRRRPNLKDKTIEIAALRVSRMETPPAIIIPVYNAFEHLQECLRSVFLHTAPPFRLILIDDGSSDPRVQELLWRHASLPNVTVVSNRTNLGYTATINCGISLARDADIVLLNSDTQVTPQWLRNLQLAAYSGERVATATPFSNNAGAFSAPQPGKPNVIPEHLGLDAYARLVTRCSARLYPKVPTGNGFCMYVRRACIDEVRAFDAGAFPRGYGEENDFCLRASAAGWTHVVDDATLIYHVRSASFGDGGEALVAKGRAIVERRFPAYPTALSDMLADPVLEKARAAVAGALKAPVGRNRVLPRMLFVISTMTGGTPRTNEDLMAGLADRAETFVLQCDARVMKLFAVSGGEYTELNSHVLKAPMRAFPHRSEEYDAVVRTWLVHYAFEGVHIRHIAWHSLGLIDEARRIGLPVIFSFHDYYSVCPTVKLLDERMTYCGGQCTPGRGRCQMELWNTDDYPRLKHAAVYDWRKQFFDGLTKCSALVTTSDPARSRILDAFPGLRDRPFEVIPHGRDFDRFDQPGAPPGADEALRLLLPGHIYPAKGRDVIAELAERAEALGIEVHILGTIEPALEARPGVVLHGSYERDDFRNKVQQIKPHIGGIFSIWPETFCHTLTELWACGIPVLAFDTGAVADRIRAHGGGWLAEVKNLDALLGCIAEIRSDPARYARKLEDVRKWQAAEGRLHTSRWMADNYWRVYTKAAPGLTTTAGDAGLPSATRDSVFGRKLIEILRTHSPHGIRRAISASEAALEAASARLEARADRPKVSIVMPTYNRARVIGEAIQSVVEQDYGEWELIVCDDASSDDTEAVVGRFGDARIRYLKLAKGGAAAARNGGLARAQGEIIAYLDSDNTWHPRFLSRMVLALVEQPGHSAVYGNYVDYVVDRSGDASVKSFERPAFDQERLLDRNFIDLNTFVHRRELYDCFGGFDEALTRRQDYDLIIKYTWLRDPLYAGELLALYQRNESLQQITTVARADESCVEIINANVARYLEKGLPIKAPSEVKRVTILSWDLCRNHFSKPFALAEALSRSHEVQLIAFRFFDEEIFPPLKGVKPSFETVYLPGPQFPDFFVAMDKAVEAITGEVVYVVKPRLPSLGTALLAHVRRRLPLVLEINDLETVVASPKSGDRHQEAHLDAIDPADPDLLNPYSDLWSRIMDPVAKRLPVLATHNKVIDAHFGGRCLYLRNLKDEAVYDPALYDRAEVRAELGFGPEDRIILFGGMVRRHKGIYELVELVERLADPRYKLLFVGSRQTPDQARLIEKFGTRIRVLPPQDRTAMARINLAADLVILWLDPDVPASHGQMPYKTTDALAMKTPIIANDISDLGDLGRQGYLRLAAFGDWDAMARTVEGIFAEPAKTAAMAEAGRRLYLRQFSYAAAGADFALMLARLKALKPGRIPAAASFARRFDDFRRHLTGIAPEVPEAREPAPPQRIESYGGAKEDASIVLLDVKALDRLSHRDPEGIAIVMPSIDTATALETARLLVRRAGVSSKVFVVEDTLRRGFIRTLNDTAARLEVKYLIYLAEDAFPGVDWLKRAHAALEATGKGLLAFNCGKWHGRIAAFGMVRMDWVKALYGGPVFYPAYRSHRADNEITAIARASRQFVYLPDAVLTEVDARKAFRVSEAAASNFTVDDKRLFISRFDSGFDGLATQSGLEPLRDEYLNQRKLARAGGRRPPGN